MGEMPCNEEFLGEESPEEFILKFLQELFPEIAMCKKSFGVKSLWVKTISV